MKMIPKRLAMALLMVASAVFSFNSHAATIDVGMLAVGDTKFGAGFEFGSISDTWLFEVVETGTLKAGFEFPVFGTIASLSASPVSGSPFTLAAPGQLVLTPVVLTPGMYSVSVTGSTHPLGFGAYVGAFQLTAVPLPAPVLLLGSAMLGLVGFARRRSA
ncbi:MAG TPA: hypothetical protein PK744_11450 [Pseudomonadales bacterium]|nr:hypothetical protein [Pseudomonadales bacterium]